MYPKNRSITNMSKIGVILGITWFVTLTFQFKVLFYALIIELQEGWGMHTYMCIPSLPMNSIKLNIITNNNLLDGLLLLSLKYRFSPLDNTEAR